HARLRLGKRPPDVGGHCRVGPDERRASRPELSRSLLRRALDDQIAKRFDGPANHEGIDGLAETSFRSEMMLYQPGRHTGRLRDVADRRRGDPARRELAQRRVADPSHPGEIGRGDCHTIVSEPIRSYGHPPGERDRRSPRRRNRGSLRDDAGSPADGGDAMTTDLAMLTASAVLTALLVLPDGLAMWANW